MASSRIAERGRQANLEFAPFPLTKANHTIEGGLG